MKIYAINLPRSLDRRAHIEQECARYALPVEIFPAVDGAALTADEIAAAVYPPAQKFLTAGEIGCACSHWRIYEKIVAEKIPVALILEDDAMFKVDPRPLFAAFDEMAIHGGGGIYLLTGDANNQYIKRNPVRVAGYEFYDMVFGARTHGYVITQAAAAKFAAFQRPIRMQADRWKYVVISEIVKVRIGATAIIGLHSSASCTTITNREASGGHGREFHSMLMRTLPWRKRVKYYLWKFLVKPWLPMVTEQVITARN
ncbi:hypothetical protein AGMMS49959_05050 [Planctomycetales bacterium]|nr:hypothetical protein AGMMS49959_05050 [Planctomycetales bacterium]